MPDIQRAGLLALLPRPNVYGEQEYVPVPLTGVKLRVQVVNFVAQVSYFTIHINKTYFPLSCDNMFAYQKYGS